MEFSGIYLMHFKTLSIIMELEHCEALGPSILEKYDDIIIAQNY